MLVFTFSACDDVFETDIENKYVRLLSPKDSLITSSNLVNFSWETMEGADSYTFQIVSNTFTNPYAYYCDSTVTTNFISFSLPAGNYQWRVRAKNFGYNSNYSVRNFTISLSADITNTIPQLILPSNGDTSNATNFLFKWNSIPNAVDYRYELWQGKVGSGNKICSVILDTNYFHYSLPQNGYYEWQVRGQNNSSNTIYSISSILCDTISPIQPVITYPQNNVTLTDSIITLNWTRNSIAGSVEFDSIYFYTDSLMSYQIDNTKSYTKAYTKKFTNGNYWWKVKSFDRAGNTGLTSILSKFSISFTKKK